MSEDAYYFASTNQVNHNLNPLDFQSTAYAKSQYFISRNKSMGIMVSILSYEPNY